MVHGHSAPSTPRRAFRDLSNQQSPHGGKREGAGRPSSVEGKARKAKAAKLKHEEDSQLQQLQQDHASLATHRGKSLTPGERRIMLNLLLSLQLYLGYTLNLAIETTTKWLQASHHTVRAVWEMWKGENTFKPAPSLKRGGGSEFHPNHRITLTPAQQTTIQSTLFDAQRLGKYCSAAQLQNKLEVEHNLDVSQQTVRNWLHKLGYKYGKSRNVGKMTKQARSKRVRLFLQQYSEALQKQKEGEYVIVYTDESYVHTSHHSRRIWFRVDSEEKNEVERSVGRGKRLILLHAMSKDGLLRKGDAVASGRIDEPAFNSELILEGMDVGEDYHKTMNGTTFLTWVKHRLIPSFKILYPSKKMILVLDNAPYHHAKPANWKNPNRMTKLEIGTWLVDRGITQVKLKRDGASRTFGLASLFVKGGKYSPTLEEMQLYMKEYLDDHPELNRTLLQEEFHKHGYKLIFTPPYTPQVQPIELVWAHVKNYVSRHTTINTKVADLQGIVRSGFYGDEEFSHEDVGPSLCRRLITSCHGWMNKFIEGDEDLDGTIDNLIVSGEGIPSIFDDLDEEEETEYESESEEDGEDEEESESDEE